MLINYPSAHPPKVFDPRKIPYLRDQKLGSIPSNLIANLFMLSELDSCRITLIYSMVLIVGLDNLTH